MYSSAKYMVREAGGVRLSGGRRHLPVATSTAAGTGSYSDALVLLEVLCGTDVSGGIRGLSRLPRGHV
jgi:hypothetical protein